VRLPVAENIQGIAEENMDIAAPKVTLTQIAEAQRLAREWKPKMEQK
jgi:hypothetical protein